MNVTLSIIIPTHDTKALTLRCLASALRWAPGAEVILVDDASTDGTADAVGERFPDVQVIGCSEPVGFTRAANLGLARARGEILLLLNSDTELEAGGAEVLLAAFAADSRLGAAGATLHYPDGSPQWSGGRAPSLLWLFALASGTAAMAGKLPLYRRIKPLGGDPSAVEWVTGAAIAVRRAAWEVVAPLDERFHFYGQDLDLCLRLRASGWRVALLPLFRVLHHHGATIRGKPGADGESQNTELLWTDLLRWASKHRGRRWAKHAAWTMAAGGTLRLIGQGLAALFRSVEGRLAWRGERETLLRAVRAVRRPL